MSFKTLLAVVDGAAADTLELAPAVGLARALDAHLSVLVVGEVPPLPFYGYGGQGYAQIWLEESERREARLKAAGAAVEARLACEGLSFDVRPRLAIAEREDNLVARHAIYADLVVLLRAVAGDLGGVEYQVVDGALFDSGRPVLVVPAGIGDRPIGRRVMVAWNSRRTAARALADALPLLLRAEEVTLVLVDPVSGPENHGDDPGADMALVLARHGLKVTVTPVPSGGKPAGEALLATAEDIGADLIVMGAYEHSRLREAILGGTTRAMLERTGIPLFLAH
ncbi:universal stress protein [Polymorphum gilvum]|uniref:UspA domain-containing protein n=1 Tax=Polymorphum gilvum (strain LMG 25793 / CGMCC 1.9160 / SL003B-26A1) TaxID=991905 RepID=F2J2B0_POLGS|nr:universal stress protein [Polymorphum gilvum]ADZ69806.1 hypothetical protein SL003B_1378 [Polymorphum gilvum SL003B-26A1]